jgi:hypothetical protein
MIRFIAFFTAFFLFFSTVEAGYWLAGRWFVSSRFANVSLQTVKNWLDRGIISGATQQAKVFIQRNGKWILLTLALSQVISEVQNMQSSAEYCYIDAGSIWGTWLSDGRFVVSHAGNNPQSFYTVSSNSTCYSGSANIPAIQIYRWVPYYSSYTWTDWAFVPKAGTYTVGQCQITITNINIGSPCGNFSAPASPDLSQRRRVPVRVFPNPADFLRDDVINTDPSLRWLRDEYQSIASDSSIPNIPSDALGDLELPSVDWTIPPDEAIDQAAESSRSGEREGEGSRDDITVPGLNTDLNIPERRSFPVELVNNLVQSHPLLRVLQGVSLDAGSGGSCVVGSRPFEFDFCQFQWVLNLMGGVIVFISFMTGLFWAGRSD